MKNIKIRAITKRKPMKNHSNHKSWDTIDAHMLFTNNLHCRRCPKVVHCSPIFYCYLHFFTQKKRTNKEKYNKKKMKPIIN